MELTSNGFLLFTAAALLIYYLLPKKLRWMELLAVSIFYYATGGVSCLGYLLFSAVVTWGVGLWLGRRKKGGRKMLLCLGIMANIGMLVLVKYLDFILENIGALFRVEVPGLSFLLPLGISFYVFQTTGYLVDVYRGEVEPEKNLAKYALFVSFFPQILQGPIGRFGRLAPQLFEGHSFSWERLTGGLLRVSWGFFKTMVIADWAAVFVDAIFAGPKDYSGLALFGVLFYSLQLYANFSGGIDVALGVASMFGIRLDENFCQPYFAVSIADFWRRWHITLGAWLRDYVYIPLGGSRRGTGRTCVNLMITFLISGIWHGANWTFVFWGFLHGFYQVVGRLTRKARQAFYEKIHLAGTGLYRVGQSLVTFLLVGFAWIFFRADTMTYAWGMVRGLFGVPDFGMLLTVPAGRDGLAGTPFALAAVAAGALVLFLVSFLRERGQLSVLRDGSWQKGLVQFAAIVVLLTAVGALGSTAQARGFIYAQF